MDLLDIIRFEYERVEGGCRLTDCVDCEDCTELEIPEGVTILGEYCFCECDRVKVFKLPKTLKVIEDGAFSDCKALQRVVFAEGTTLISVGEGAFSNSGIGEITLPTSVTGIGEGAFSNCMRLRKINLSQLIHLFEIADDTFSNCTSLEAVSLPVGVHRVGMDAFAGCTSLLYAEIPSTVDEMDMDVFSDCNRLREITVDLGKIPRRWDPDFLGCDAKVNLVGSNTQDFTPIDKFETVPYECYGDCGLKLIRPLEPIKEVILHPSIVYIENHAFEHDKTITRFKAGKRLQIIGTAAFHNCSNLSSFELEEPRSASIMPEAFACTRVKHAYLTNSDIGFTGVYARSDVESFSVPSGYDLSTIPARTFSDTKLTDVVIPKTVGTIYSRAFSRCRLMRTLDLGDVRNVREEAFSGCTALTSIRFPDNGYCDIEVRAFEECSSLTKIDLGSVSTLRTHAFSCCTSLREVTVNSTTLSYEAPFINCPIEKIIFKTKTYAEIEYGINKWLTGIGGSHDRWSVKIVCKDGTVTRQKEHGRWQPKYPL